MNTYHAFQVTRPGSYAIWADLSEPHMIAVLRDDLTCPGIESVIVGTVEGPDVPSALNAIRDGEWLKKRELEYPFSI